MDIEGSYSRALETQKQLCDEGMNLVNAGVSLQNAGDTDLAEQKFSRAVDIFERALQIPYETQEEQEAATRLNTKMLRYVNMIKSQRAKNPTFLNTKRAATKFNILDMDNLPEIYHSIAYKISRYSRTSIVVYFIVVTTETTTMIDASIDESCTDECDSRRRCVPMSSL